MFPEPEDDEIVRSAFLFGVFLWVAVLTMLALLNGCVSAPVAPNLKFPEAPAKECPRLVMPPIPDHVFLKVEGDKVFSDDGGDVLLRGYSRARQLLR